MVFLLLLKLITVIERNQERYGAQGGSAGSGNLLAFLLLSIWSPLALEHVEDIARYIAEDNPDAAVQWVDDLFSTVGRLADFPKSGGMVPEVGSPRIRELIFGTYRVIYSVAYSGERDRSFRGS